MTAFINQKAPNLDFRAENEGAIEEENKEDKENSQPHADFLKRIEGMFDEKMEQEMSTVQQKFFQLHVQLIREMTKQSEDMKGQLEKFARKNQKYKRELKDLREENAQLKKLSY